MTYIANRLPANASVETKQDLQITQETAINTKLATILSLHNLEIQKGLAVGVTVVNKSGRNPVITTSSAPEDMWNGSAVYSGFPTGAPEVLSFFSSSVSDTGVLTYFYLATTTSTVWQSATVTLNGIIPVSGVSAYRVHSASYNTGVSTTFNVGTITCRHITTIVNVFFNMPPATSQTYAAVYTIPFGSTGFIESSFCDVNSSAAVEMQGAFWIRGSGMSPRLRRNFNVTNTLNYMEENKYLKLSQMTDITMRIISSSSASSRTVIGGFNIITVNQVL